MYVCCMYVCLMLVCDVSNNSQFLISLKRVTIFVPGGIALHTAMVTHQKLGFKCCRRGSPPLQRRRTSILPENSGSSGRTRTKWKELQSPKPTRTPVQPLLHQPYACDRQQPSRACGDSSLKLQRHNATALNYSRQANDTSCRSNYSWCSFLSSFVSQQWHPVSGGHHVCTHQHKHTHLTYNLVSSIGLHKQTTHIDPWFVVVCAVLLTKKIVTKLCDFGLSKLRGVTRSSVNSQASVGGGEGAGYHGLPRTRASRLTSRAMQVRQLT